MYGAVPAFLRNYFQHVREAHSISTRASVADVRLSKFESLVGKRSFSYLGAFQWNSLDLATKLTSNLRTFKVLTKTWLLEKVPL